MYERYNLIFQGERILRPNQTTKFTFDLTEEQLNENRFRLFFKGETKQFYYFKTEPMCIYDYMSINDALNSEQAQSASYCLDFSLAKPVPYMKAVRNEILFEPTLGYLKLTDYASEWTAGIRVKAENLQINGSIQMSFLVRLLKSTSATNDFSCAPDYTETLIIDAGTYDWCTKELTLSLSPHEVASVEIYLEANDYCGNLYFESPYLLSNAGFNVLPDFEPPIAGYDELSWLGLNLSQKEWPEFELSANGTPFYSGSFFERCHRYSEMEKDIPKSFLHQGENTLELRLITPGREPLPFSLSELGLFFYQDAPFTIIGTNPNAVVGNQIHLLIRTRKENCIISCSSTSNVIVGEIQSFAEPGLHVFHAVALKEANNVEILLSDSENTCSFTIQQIAFKQSDDIIVGSGDMVYVNAENKEELETYLCWYVSQNIGNLMTLRPCYRWCGNRSVHEQNWKWFIDLLNELDIKYSHMLDGRELPGLNANPTKELITGKGFLGRQLHERDGAYSYWGFQNQLQKPFNARMYAWMLRLTKQYPDTVNPLLPDELIAEDYAIYRYLSPNKNNIQDMKLAAENLIKELSYIRLNSTRHTGPSTHFKYFIQAGYEMVGAETMYGPTEVVLAFLRGVSKCYDLPTDSVHLAMQWSTHPHDVPEHEKRFRLALYVPYMQGIKEINTEEGLWHIEEFYNSYSRNGDCCQKHTVQQQDMLRYISTHTRRGTYYTPFAFISGRYDGFRSFGRANVMGTTMNVGTPEHSWRLLKQFYPLTEPSGTLYFHPTPVKPLGFHSGTPNGNVDVLPIESSIDKFSYKAMFFAGYNCAIQEDMDKLYDYIINGGILLAGIPHFSTVTDRKMIESGEHLLIEHKLTQKIKETIIENRSSDGKKLFKIPLGNGMLYFVNSNLYPGDDEIAPIYENAISEITENLLSKEEVYMTCKDTVQFTVYETADGMRDFYVLATDWYNDDAIMRQATLRIQNTNYPIDVPANTLLKITVKDNIAVWAESENGEVLDIQNGLPKLQGYGTVRFHIIKNGKHTIETKDFSQL